MDVRFLIWNKKGAGAFAAGVNDYAETAGSDIVIITAGLARKPGMNRLDLLKKNAEIISGIVENVKDASPDSVIIMVTNPIDVMVYLAYQKSGFPSQRVFGQTGIRDSYEGGIRVSLIASWSGVLSAGKVVHTPAIQQISKRDAESVEFKISCSRSP